MYYLSKEQVSVIRSKGLALLEPYADSLPGWVPTRLVARALGYNTAAIEAAECRHGNNYAWCTEFENVHSTWTFAEPGFVVGNRRFNGSEQLYQLLKAGDLGSEGFEKHADLFASSAEIEVYARGRDLILRPDWEACKDTCMMFALRLKFESNYGLRKLLLSTYPRPLVSVKSDKYWGAGLNGTGLNRLGELLVELRTDLMAQGGGVGAPPLGGLPSRVGRAADGATDERPLDAPPLPPAEWDVPREVIYGKERNALMSGLRNTLKNPGSAKSDPVVEDKQDAFEPAFEEEASAAAAIDNDGGGEGSGGGDSRVTVLGRVVLDVDKLAAQHPIRFKCENKMLVYNACLEQQGPTDPMVPTAPMAFTRTKACRLPLSIEIEALEATRARVQVLAGVFTYVGGRPPSTTHPPPLSSTYLSGTPPPPRHAPSGTSILPTNTSSATGRAASLLRMRCRYRSIQCLELFSCTSPKPTATVTVTVIASVPWYHSPGMPVAPPRAWSPTCQECALSTHPPV
mmetsp:Transcript_4237/g.8803  ORF Transcript_4237/g.8803 Transcript_4237/m.8803 type:complete len:514 (-) Transcript_4237:393-1934(-)